MLLGRTRVQMYWPVLLWAIGLLAMCVQSWWAMFGLRDVSEWTFAEFAVVLLQTVFTYMLAALVFPDFFANEAVDLRSHYFAHVRWFFGLFIAVLVASLAKDLVISGHLPGQVNVGFHLAFIAAALIAILTRQETYHKALAVVGMAAFAAYTLLLFSRLH
jgi:branched-subunit amino acid transport protein